MASRTVDGNPIADSSLTAGAPSPARGRNVHRARSDRVLMPLVPEHRHLERSKQREVLAAWASDANAVPGKPALRRIPGSNRIVPIDTILDAPKELDADSDGQSVPLPSPVVPALGYPTSQPMPP